MRRTISSIAKLVERQNYAHFGKNNKETQTFGFINEIWELDLSSLREFGSTRRDFEVMKTRDIFYECCRIRQFSKKEN
jgi:hypothetical protein